MNYDNSDIQQKINVRKKGLSLRNGEFSVLDMYAGEGHITNILWSKVAQKVKCIEKEPGKLKLSISNVECVEGDNNLFISDAGQYEVIDCDGYGLTQYLIKKLIPECRPNTLIFFTEFNPIRVNKNWENEFINSMLSYNIRAIYKEKGNFTKAIYGYLII